MPTPLVTKELISDHTLTFFVFILVHGSSVKQLFIRPPPYSKDTVI